MEICFKLMILGAQGAQTVQLDKAQMELQIKLKAPPLLFPHLQMLHLEIKHLMVLKVPVMRHLMLQKEETKQLQLKVEIKHPMLQQEVLIKHLTKPL